MAVNPVACAELLAGLDPSCEALNKIGGVAKRVWIGQVDQRASYTVDGTSKAVNTVLMKELSTGVFYQLFKFIGKRDKHDFGAVGTGGENAPTYEHTGILTLYAFSQLEQNKIEDLFKADDLFCFIETYSGQIKVYGIDKGLNGTNLEVKEGVLPNDPTSIKVTLVGIEMKMPMIFNTATGTLAANITYLDAKNGTAA